MRLTREPRYRCDTFPGPSLAGNPLGSPDARPLHIYLPPGYESGPGLRYPVIYFLHGYGDGPGTPTIPPARALRSLFPLRLLAPGVFARILTYERLDALIRGGELPPFILVQPDASLRRPRLYPTPGLGRAPQAKGSMYVDSPRTGRYGEYVFRDVVEYVDRSYRTLAGRDGRAMAGASMGGYGALRGGILHPERFAAAAALSPVVGFLALQELTLVVPIARRLFGSRPAAALGRRTMADILETCAWVFGPDRRQWADADLAFLAASTPGALRGVSVHVDCEAEDEYGLAGPCRRLSGVLEGLGVPHELEIYSDPLAARYSPHTLGIAGRILPALRFCLDRLRPASATAAAPPPAGPPPG